MSGPPQPSPANSLVAVIIGFKMHLARHLRDGAPIPQLATLILIQGEDRVGGWDAATKATLTQILDRSQGMPSREKLLALQASLESYLERPGS